MGKDGPALQVTLGNRATVIRGEDWNMTDDEGPLGNERLLEDFLRAEIEEFIQERQAIGVPCLSPYLLRDFIAHKVGREEGHQAATKFIATGETE